MYKSMYINMYIYAVLFVNWLLFAPSMHREYVKPYRRFCLREGYDNLTFFQISVVIK